MRLFITYDPEAGAAYVYIGPARHSARTVELDGDGSVMVDYDEYDEVVGIEIIGCSAPGFEVLRRRKGREDVEVKDELL